MALTSRLEAINCMLSGIGEAPINQLNQSTVDSVMAEHVLDETDRETQQEGWHFNTEYNVELTPDSVTNQINLPLNALRVDLDSVSAFNRKDIVQRGMRIYDKENKTDQFTKSLKLTIIYQLVWDDLPEAARAYIMIRAARKFQNRVVGSKELAAYQAADEQAARARLEEFESDTGDHNFLNNYSAMRVLNRASNPFPVS